MGAYHLKDHPYRLRLKCAIPPVENGEYEGHVSNSDSVFLLILRECLVFQVSSPFKMFLHFDT